MGVSGSGKSTVAARLAQRMGAQLAEADEFHSATNIAKMSSGHPLDDKDRATWLRAIAEWLHERAQADEMAVVACSALKRSYRDVLRTAGPGVRFVHLAGSQELIAGRLRGRAGHFMPAELLSSQFADLEPLGAGERGITVNIGTDAPTLAARIADQLTSQRR